MMNELGFRRICAAIAVSLTTTMASAAPVTWFGADHTLSGATTTPGQAFDDFTSGLFGLGTEDFESYAHNQTGFDLNFGNGITAGVDGTFVEADNTPGAGRYPTSGTTFLETEDSGGFTLTFSSEINAFGFFAADVGDFGNNLFLELLGGPGTVRLDIVTPTDAASGIPDGGLLFFGFFDESATYTGIKFGFEGGTVDRFAVDDVMAGLATLTPVPVPPAAGLLLLGIGAFAGIRRLKRTS